MGKPYRPFRQPGIHASKQLSVTDARTQLCLLLANARSLDSFTAENLARQYRVPLEEIRKRLELARVQRAARETLA